MLPTSSSTLDQKSEFVSVLNRTRTVSEILYLYMDATIRVTSQLANPLLVGAATPCFPFTNRQVAKSGIAQYHYSIFGIN
eukprot:COSAG02_NODE_1884_length_10516_cov_4.173466_4_plen_80_part_00